MADDGPDRALTAGTPRWVKLLAIVFVILPVVIVIVHVPVGGLARLFDGHTP